MTSRWGICLLTAAAVLWCRPAAAQEAPVDYTGHKMVNVTLPTEAELDRMLAITEKFATCRLHLGTVPFIVSPAEFAQLEASGLEYTVLHDNVQELIDAERAENEQGQRDDSWFTAYKSYVQVNTRLDELVALRPDLCSKFTVGSSIEGRTVYGLRITGPGDSSGRAGLMFDGCQHAREWIAVMVPMYIADRMIETYDTDSAVAALLDEAVVYVVPIANPDGYEYSRTTDRYWRKNRRNNGGGIYGVDLNRNWGQGWGGAGSSGNPSDETYRGTAPFSEPETQILRNFAIAHPEIVAHIDFHSYSQLILYPYGYDYILPPEPDLSRFVDLSADMADAILATHGEVYIDQPSYDLYLAAGDMPDWMYGNQGIFAWTIELRPDSAFPGFELPASEILPTAEESFAAVMSMSQQMVIKLLITYPAGHPSQVPAEQPTAFQVSIQEVNAQLQAGSEKLFVSVDGGAFVETALTALGGTLYQATLPATPCGGVLDYYVEAQTTQGAYVRSPSEAPASTWSATASEITLAADDTMETATAWTVGATGDNATTGIWNRMDPQATAAQPEDDHTPAPGVNCWVTDGRAGTSIGTYDVDGGRTSLTSPAYNLSAMTDPYVSYWRWFSNNQGSAPNEDVFRVQITDGATWVTAETVGPASAESGGGWFYHEFRVRDFVALSGSVQLRFIAEDAGGGSIVEAAVDDLQIRDFGCPEPEPCPGDLNGDGVRDLADLSALLSNYGSPAGMTYEDGDMDGDGDVDLADLSAILEVYGLACP
ncbi:MAG: hypothetical protein HRF50_02280 [Phycisphaerae bacterium]|jgi:hypothetical protein